MVSSYGDSGAAGFTGARLGKGPNTATIPGIRRTNKSHDGPALNEELLSEVIDRIYACALDDEWQGPVDNLAEIFRAHGGAFFVQDLESSDVPVMQFTRFDPAAIESYVDHYAALNPWIEAEDNFPAGRAVLGEMLVDDDVFLKTPFYNEWLQPQGLRHALGSVVTRDQKTLCKLTLIRPRRIGAYSSEDLRALNIFIRHIRRALHLREKLAHASEQASMKSEIVNRLRIGAALVRGNGEIQDLNAAMRQTIAERDGLSVENRFIVAARSSETTSLQRAITDACKTARGASLAAPDSLRLPRPSGREPLLAVVIPMPEMAGAWFDGLNPPSALVLVQDPENSVEPDVAVLTRMYGLAPSEARVAKRISKGMRVEEIALDLEISRETVRTHVKRILSKTETKNQADLVRLILTGPAPLASDRPY